MDVSYQLELGQCTKGYTLKENKFSFFPKSHQLPIASQLGMGSSESLPLSYWNVAWLGLV